LKTKSIRTEEIGGLATQCTVEKKTPRFWLYTML
jgi:hypothetical protein